MEKDKAESLERYCEELEADVPGARRVLEQLARAGLSLGRAEPVGDRLPRRTWLLFWRPPEPLRERFDLAPELLTLLTAWREAQAQDIDAAEDALRRNHRLDRGVVLLVAVDEQAGTRLTQPIGQTGRIYIAFSFSEIEMVRDPQRWLRDTLSQRIGTSNLFAAGRPVFGWDFVGREIQLREIRGRLLEGHPVGLYGLRKIGKTSLLLTLRDQFVDDARRGQIGALPIHLDLLRISFAEMDRTGVLRSLLQAVLGVLERTGLSRAAVGLDPRVAREHLGGLAARDVESLAASSLERLVDWAQRVPSQPSVLLFIDEYERLLGTSRIPEADGLEIFNFLRGLVQQYPRRFNFLIAGLDRRRAARPRYGESQNPLFNFVVHYPLAGLEHQELNELFRKIGRRLSLRFEPDALELIWEETGGHPYLAREYGRLIDRDVPVEERKPKFVDRALVARHRTSFRLHIRDTMIEIQAALRDLDPKAPEALRLLRAFPDEPTQALGDLHPESVEALHRYGILRGDPGRPAIRIGCLGAWLDENPGDLHPGEVHV